MDNLFSLVDLAVTLRVDQSELDVPSASEARRRAQAELVSVTALTEWPTPVPEDLRAWAIELAALAYDNPSGLDMEQVEGVTVRWPKGRPGEILKAARRRYGLGASAGLPSGSFPDPEAWPDPYAKTC